MNFSTHELIKKTSEKIIFLFSIPVLFHHYYDLVTTGTFKTVFVKYLMQVYMFVGMNLLVMYF